MAAWHCGHCPTDRHPHSTATLGRLLEMPWKLQHQLPGTEGQRYGARKGGGGGVGRQTHSPPPAPPPHRPSLPLHQWGTRMG